MPTITFNWTAYTPADQAPYLVFNGAAWIPAPWITKVQWRNAGNVELATDAGVYIIEQNVNMPVYTGKSVNLRGRFSLRSDALADLHITSNTLATWRVWASSVTIAPANYRNRLDWAEYWLVRYLFARDLANPPSRLQNILLTAPFQAPPDGLTIQFATGNGPAYLTNPASPFWVPNPNFARYTYAGGAMVTQ